MMRLMSGSVLVVDDDPAFRRVARVVLATFGLGVAGEAHSAEAAMAEAAALRPDGVLVDIGLPDRDGIALAHDLVALPWRPRVLLTSTNPEAATAAEVSRSGAQGFVLKEELLNASLLELFGCAGV
jgi:DNA-binding NarL/FixJ family response regulator